MKQTMKIPDPQMDLYARLYMDGGLTEVVREAVRRERERAAGILKDKVINLKHRHRCECLTEVARAIESEG